MYCQVQAAASTNNTIKPVNSAQSVFQAVAMQCSRVAVARVKLEERNKRRIELNATVAKSALTQTLNRTISKLEYVGITSNHSVEFTRN